MLLLLHLGRHRRHQTFSHTHIHTLTHGTTWVPSYGCLSCSNYMMCGNCQSLKRALQTHFKGSGARPRTQLTRSTEPRWAGGPRAPLPIVLIFTLISEYAVGMGGGGGGGGGGGVDWTPAEKRCARRVERTWHGGANTGEAQGHGC